MGLVMRNPKTEIRRPKEARSGALLEKAPSTKLQAPEKLQDPSFKPSSIEHRAFFVFQRELKPAMAKTMNIRNVQCSAFYLR
jgi:hypothetical protein